MYNKDNILKEVREKLETDREIIEYLDKHPNERVNLIYQMKRDELHKALMAEVERAVKSGDVEINSIEDLVTAVRLDLLLS
jgi:predicted site-specific integrase-resolvase